MIIPPEGKADQGENSPKTAMAVAPLRGQTKVGRRTGQAVPAGVVYGRQYESTPYPYGLEGSGSYHLAVKKETL